MPTRLIGFLLHVTMSVWCLINRVQMLVKLTFHGDYWNYNACRVPAVDILWQRPEVTESKYRGVKDFSIVPLA